MTPDQRLDYFRSEFEARVAKLAKELADDRVKNAAALQQLGQRVDKLTIELRNLER